MKLTDEERARKAFEESLEDDEEESIQLDDDAPKAKDKAATKADKKGSDFERGDFFSQKHPPKYGSPKRSCIHNGILNN